jgi:hypothetical protein
VSAGSVAYAAGGLSCLTCHGAPQSGVTVWRGALGGINLYDADNNGYKTYPSDGGNQVSVALNIYTAMYMPSIASHVTQTTADNITAYLTHTVNVGKNWCPGDAWPPAGM